MATQTYEQNGGIEYYWNMSRFLIEAIVGFNIFWDKTEIDSKVLHQILWTHVVGYTAKYNEKVVLVYIFWYTFKATVIPQYKARTNSIFAWKIIRIV